MMQKDTTHIYLKLNHKLENFKEELNQIDKQLLIDFPESSYYSILQLLPLTGKYQFLPPDLIKTANCIRKRYGQKTVSIYHRLALCLLIKKSLIDLNNKSTFPETVTLFYDRYFQWMLQHIFDNNSDNINYYQFKNDLFLKDLSLCSLRMFPVGSQVVELSNAPRRFVISGGSSQFLEAASFYLTMLRGRSPFYQVHLDTRWLNDFNRGGWYEFYKVIADMLQRNPDVRGIFGGSWFYDPMLEKISPGLLYLRKIPEQGAARLFKVGTHSLDIENATYKSERRRKLYEEGAYIPTSYVFIWLRDDLIRWAETAQKIPAVYPLSNQR